MKLFREAGKVLGLWNETENINESKKYEGVSAETGQNNSITNCSEMQNIHESLKQLRCFKQYVVQKKKTTKY